MVESITAYTSQAEIERIWSVQGAAVHVDDYLGDETPPNDDATFQAAVWDEIIAEATDEVNFYLAKFYEPGPMALNRWVRTRATWIGCYLLSLRRGDPGYYQTLYDKAIAQLERVDETHPVPRLSYNQSFTPSMSNIRIDDRFRVAQQRVMSTISTGGTSSLQHQDPDLIIEPWQQ